MFGRMLCKCELHSWSAVEPGSVHLTNDEYAIIGVLWAQVGTQKCARPSCTAIRQIVREGEHGYDGLNIYAGGCYQVTDLDTTRGWGRSSRDPEEVRGLKPYTHRIAVERLGVPTVATA
jgi:hypothetical protein